MIKIKVDLTQKAMTVMLTKGFLPYLSASQPKGMARSKPNRLYQLKLL